MPGEVPVQVHAVGVTSASSRCSVRIQIRDDPEVDARRWTECEEPFCDRGSSALVAVDAADHEYLPGAGWIAGFDRDDRTSVDRAAEEEPVPARDGISSSGIDERRGVQRTARRGHARGNAVTSENG